MTRSNSDAENHAVPGDKPTTADALVPEAVEDDARSAKANEGDVAVPAYGAKPMGDDHATPGDQERVLTDEEKHEKALEDTFPTSDPIPPSRIDGPND